MNQQLLNVLIDCTTIARLHTLLHDVFDVINCVHGDMCTYELSGHFENIDKYSFDDCAMFY